MARSDLIIIGIDKIETIGYSLLWNVMFTCCWSPGILCEVVTPTVLELWLTVKTEFLELLLQVVLLRREEWLLLMMGELARAVERRGRGGHGGGAPRVGVVLGPGLGVARGADQGPAPRHGHQPRLLLDRLQLLGLLPQQTLQQVGRGLDVLHASAAVLRAVLLTRGLLIVRALRIIQFLVEGGV